MKKKLLFTVTLLIAIKVIAQITIVKSFPSSEEPDNATANQIINNKLIYSGFSTNSSPLYTTDGTTAGTGVLLKDLGVNYTHSFGNNVQYTYAKTDTKIYINKIEMDDTYNGSTRELWVTDGTTANTIKLFTSNSGIIIGFYTYDSDNQRQMPNSIGDKLIFIAKDPSSTQNILYVSDGTVSGTLPLLSSTGQKIYNTTVGTKMNGKYYFSGRTDVALGTNGSRLWVTDGTQAGTHVVNSSQNDPTFITDVVMSNPINNKIYFWAGNSATGYELWQSDGTDIGTSLFYETATGATTLKSSYGTGMGVFAHANNLYFLLQPTAGVKTFDLYCAKNGDVNNIQKIYTTIDYNITSVYPNTDGRVYFQEQPFTSGNNYRLITSDGTSAGTYLLGNFTPNSPKEFISYNGNFYFGNNSGTPINIELWRTDFLSNNYNQISDLYPGCINASICYSTNPRKFFKLNNELYFIGDGSGVRNLYKFNGDYTFNGSTNNSWNVETNWNAGFTPLSNDNITIPSGYNVSIDNNAYANDLSANSSINISAGNLNISGNLNLGAKITLNNNNLNLKGGNSLITNGNTTNYIVTNGSGTINIENLNSSRGTVNLPIGTSSNYNPILIANSGTSDTFSAKVSEGNTATNPTINATWEISEAVSGGSNASVTLGWNQSQENSGFDRNSAKIGHFLGGNWIEENSGTFSGTNPYTITATGITSFSPFSVMNFSTLGNSEVEKSKVQVFPNPFNENLNISTEENGVVYFYDLSGKLVATEKLLKGNNTFNKSLLKSGVYIYKIKNMNGEIISSGKVIKKS